MYFQVMEAGLETLPSWLSFNPLTAELKGIPEPKDKGQVYLEVKAIGDNSQADDVFSIEVIDDSSMSIGASVSKLQGENIPKLVRCRREEPETVSTVIVDVDIHSLNPSERISVFSNLASHLNLATEMLKLMPVGDKPMFDTTALVAGPGDTRSPKHQGVLVSWLVGCGKVESDHLPVLQLLESSAANGDMGSALGHDIVGWHVTNSRFQQKPRRKRAATATPTMSMPAPTKVSDMTSASVKPTKSSSVAIQPTKTVPVQQTSVVVQQSSSVSMESSSISPSPTVKMTKTMDVTPQPTTVLPSKTFTMTSSAVITQSSTTSTQSTTKSTTTQSTKKPTTAAPTPEPFCPPFRGIKKAPMVNKPIRNFTIMAGEVFKYKIPEDTFFDCYNDKTSDLDLELLLNGKQVPSGFWMVLKKKVFKPYRLMANPLNIHSENYKFALRAENFYGKTVEQEFFVDVLGEEMTHAPPSHELSMTIDMDYDDFMSDLNNRIEFTSKLAGLYGDSNSDSILVTRIERGSVIFAWTNKTLPGDSCPASDIENLVNKLVNEDGSLSNKATEAMQPYKIASAASVPLGECSNDPKFPTRDTRKAKVTTAAPTEKQTPAPTTKATTKPTEKKTVKPSEPPTPEPTAGVDKTTHSPTSTTDTKVAAAGAGGGSDIWITTVVPAIVVVVVLIIALIIACCLYRKKRKGKMKLEEQNSFSNKKGVPVIFADEYEDRPNDSTKPLIMRDEKPPVLPPEYQRASSEGSAGSNSTQPIGEGEEIEMDETSPLYQPPPPVTASSSNKPPPPHLQASRNPPPYVPP